jgi:hypothetical protein
MGQKTTLAAIEEMLVSFSTLLLGAGISCLVWRLS